MTRRQARVREDARHIHDRVDDVLHREDGLIFLVDGSRATSYAGGFGLSPCQLELLTHDMERLVRAVTRPCPGEREEHA